MKKASSHFLLLLLAALLMSFQSYAQTRRPAPAPRPVPEDRRPAPQPIPQPLPQTEVLREQVNQSLRVYERLSLADVLRLSYQEQSSLEIVSLTVSAQTLREMQAQLDLLQDGRLLSSQIVRRQLSEVTFALPARTMIDGLEIVSPSEIYLSGITAQVVRSYPGPGPIPGPGYEQQVSPNSLITLQVNQQVRGYAVIPLDQIARQQLGVTLSGAQIERVVIEGQPLAYGRAASVQVELNRRPVGDIKYLSPTQRQLPLQVQSFEEVQSLALIVNGDAQIFSIRVRVGSVRPQGPQMPTTQRFQVNQEISPRLPLELSHIVGYDTRQIRSIVIQARTRGGQSQVQLLTNYGPEGYIMVGMNPVRATLPLRRSVSASELRLDVNSPVIIEALEIEFESYPRF